MKRKMSGSPIPLVLGLLGFVATITAIEARAQNTIKADQGKPGNQGPWPVTVIGPVVVLNDGGVTGITVVVVFDGGPVSQGPGADGGVNWAVDVASIAGAPTTVGNGVTTANTPRVTISSDSTGQVRLAAGAATIGQLTANQSVNVAQINGSTTASGAGVTTAGTQRVVLPTDQSAIPVTFAGTQIVSGLKANNSVAPGATNLGVLPALANAATPAWTEGNQVLMSVDLSGNNRTNVTQFGGTNISTGTGASGAGIPRVTISNDSSLAANQSVNLAQVAGATTAVNNGIATAATQRVVIASDQTAYTVNARTNDSTGNGIESAITEVVGVNRGLLVRPVDKTLTAPVITAVSCGTTSTALPTTANRKTICIENQGNGAIYIGPVGVTTATGFPIGKNSFWCDDVGSQAYFCINASGTNNVRVLEN